MAWLEIFGSFLSGGWDPGKWILLLYVVQSCHSSPIVNLKDISEIRFHTISSLNITNQVIDPRRLQFPLCTHLVLPLLEIGPMGHSSTLAPQGRLNLFAPPRGLSMGS